MAKKMTPKQALIARLNELRAEVGEPPMSEKIAARRSIGVIQMNVEMYERERGA